MPDSSQTSSQVIARQRGDIYTEHDFELYEGRFVRFIESINKIRAASTQRGVGSLISGKNSIHTDSSAPIRRKVASAPQSIGRVRSVDNSSPDLEIITDSWLKHLQQNPTTISIARESLPLPATLFVAYDLIVWLISKIPNIGSKEEAINYANQMLQNRLIRLLPNNIEADENGSIISSNESEESAFRYGYHLYLVVTSTVGADIMFMEDKSRVLVNICDFCTNDVLTECKFTSRSIPLEITNTSFNVRNIQSKFTEWCRVGVNDLRESHKVIL